MREAFMAIAAGPKIPVAREMPLVEGGDVAGV